MKFNIDRRQFIEEVKNRPLLWNKNEQQFVNKAMSSLLWEEVGVICGTSGKFAKCIWRNLKDQYRRECAMKQKNKYKRLWIYFDQMSFMKDIIIGGKRDGLNVSITSTEKDKELITVRGNDEGHYEENMMNEELFIKSEFPESVYVQEDDEEIGQGTNGQENYEEEQNNLTSLQNKIQQEQLYLERLKREILKLERQKCAASQRSADGDMQFFKSLLAYMESFTPLEKLEVRTKIQQIVLDRYSKKCKSCSL